MATLPTGTVTFLFSDIEGSTHILKDLGERYAEVLTEHRAVLRDALAARGGQEVDAQGDAFFFVFQSARNAVAAAVAAQRAIVGHRWPGGATIRIRGVCILVKHFPLALDTLASMCTGRPASAR